MSLLTLIHLLPKEPRQTQLLQVLRLRVAAQSLQRQNITNKKLQSCYFGFPVIRPAQCFQMEVRKSIPDPMLTNDKFRGTPKQMF